MTGSVSASYVVAATEGQANVGMIGLPAFATVKLVAESFAETLAEQCSSCTLVQEDFPNTVLAAGEAPTRIVSFLRANPEVDWLFLANDSLALGLPAALKAAGLDERVKFSGAIGSVANAQMIQSGQEQATFVTPVIDISWQMVDAMARQLAGDDPTASMVSSPQVLWTKDNLPADVSGPLQEMVPTMKTDYAKLWGK